MFNIAEKNISDNSFYRNVITLMTGNAIAQAIPIAISPILTRLYSPEDFGILATFLSIVGIVSVVATGRYELAILLPEDDKDAIILIYLSVIILLIFTTGLFFIVFFFNGSITQLLDNNDLSKWLYFIPVSIFLTGSYQISYYWSNRSKMYKKMSVSRVSQSTGTSFVYLVMGFLRLGVSGLILGRLFGQLLSNLFLLFNNHKRIIHSVSKSSIKTQALRYKNFPKFLAVSHLINAASSNLPSILFSSMFNVTVVGFFALTQRSIVQPMTIISGSVGDVFREKASKDYFDNGNCKEIYISTLKKLIYISIIPFTVFFFIAPGLFNFVFGKEWVEAGYYAQIMTIMFFLKFIANPLSIMFVIAEKQKLDLLWQVALIIFVIFAIFIGYYFNSIIISIYFYSLFYSIMYIINLIMTNHFANGNK